MVFGTLRVGEGRLDDWCRRGHRLGGKQRLHLGDGLEDRRGGVGVREVLGCLGQPGVVPGCCQSQEVDGDAHGVSGCRRIELEQRVSQSERRQGCCAVLNREPQPA